MKLVDMKMEPKKETKETTAGCCSPCCEDNPPDYPWGLQLRLEKEQIEKVPELANYKVGESIVLSAEAVITGINISERRKDDSHTIEIQIQKLGCEPVVKKSLSEMSPKEYKEARGY